MNLAVGFEAAAELILAWVIASAMARDTKLEKCEELVFG